MKWTALLTSGILILASGAFALGRMPVAERDQELHRSPPALVEGVVRLRTLAEEGRFSQVMDSASWLADVYGPRVTGSSSLEASARWVEERLRGWGMTAVREPYGVPDDGLSGAGTIPLRARLTVSKPIAIHAEGVAVAGAAGTSGPLSRELIYVETLDRVGSHGAFEPEVLRDKWILFGEVPSAASPRSPEPLRMSDSELLRLERPTSISEVDKGEELPLVRVGPGIRGGRTAVGQSVIDAALVKSGAVGVIRHHPAGFHLIPSISSPNPLPHLPSVWVSAETFGRLARTLQKGIALSATVDIEVEAAHMRPFNLLAEIPGHDPSAGVVMLGAHLDSVHAGTGATDNAAGVAVAMDALRLLRESGLPLRRTVRVAFWTGEEQGLLGSRAYVADHAAQLRQDLWGYFNLDGGGGAIRGLYDQGSWAAEPVLRQLLSPLRDLGAATVAAGSALNSDHVAFAERNLLGWHFLQDDAGYAFAKHTNFDTYERLRSADMERNVVIVAVLLYMASNYPGSVLP